MESGVGFKSDLDALSDESFVAGWKAIVGEPPAILLDDRREMIALLVEGARVAPTVGLTAASCRTE